jgi:hypothetical protein
MVRLALAALLLAAVPAYAEGTADHRGAMDKALRCVHAVMTDALLPVGVTREQIAQSALARCFDEIEAAVAAVAAGSRNLNAVRATLRKELHTYAVLVTSAARGHDDSDSGFATARSAPDRSEPLHRVSDLF